MGGVEGKMADPKKAVITAFLSAFKFSVVDEDEPKSWEELVDTGIEGGGLYISAKQQKYIVGKQSRTPASYTYLSPDDLATYRNAEPQQPAQGMGFGGGGGSGIFGLPPGSFGGAAAAGGSGLPLGSVGLPPGSFGGGGGSGMFGLPPGSVGLPPGSFGGAAAAGGSGLPLGSVRLPPGSYGGGGGSFGGAAAAGGSGLPLGSVILPPGSYGGGGGGAGGGSSTRVFSTEGRPNYVLRPLGPMPTEIEAALNPPPATPEITPANQTAILGSLGINERNYKAAIAYINNALSLNGAGHVQFGVGLGVAAGATAIGAINPVTLLAIVYYSPYVLKLTGAAAASIPDLARYIYQKLTPILMKIYHKRSKDIMVDTLFGYVIADKDTSIVKYSHLLSAAAISDEMKSVRVGNTDLWTAATAAQVANNSTLTSAIKLFISYRTLAGAYPRPGEPESASLTNAKVDADECVFIKHFFVFNYWLHRKYAARAQLRLFAGSLDESLRKELLTPTPQSFLSKLASFIMKPSPPTLNAANISRTSAGGTEFAGLINREDWRIMNSVAANILANSGIALCADFIRRIRACMTVREVGAAVIISPEEGGQLYNDIIKSINESTAQNRTAGANAIKAKEAFGRLTSRVIDRTALIAEAKAAETVRKEIEAAAAHAEKQAHEASYGASSFPTGEAAAKRFGEGLGYGAALGLRTFTAPLQAPRAALTAARAAAMYAGKLGAAAAAGAGTGFREGGGSEIFANAKSGLLFVLRRGAAVTPAAAIAAWKSTQGIRDTAYDASLLTAALLEAGIMKIQDITPDIMSGIAELNEEVKSTFIQMMSADPEIDLLINSARVQAPMQPGVRLAQKRKAENMSNTSPEVPAANPAPGGKAIRTAHFGDGAVAKKSLVAYPNSENSNYESSNSENSEDNESPFSGAGGGPSTNGGAGGTGLGGGGGGGGGGFGNMGGGARRTRRRIRHIKLRNRKTHKHRSTHKHKKHGRKVRFTRTTRKNHH